MHTHAASLSVNSLVTCARAAASGVLAALRQLGASAIQLNRIFATGLKRSKVDKCQVIWESDLIMGANNRSAVATMVERTSRFVILAKLDAPTADAALEGMTRELSRMAPALLKTMTHDQGSEMAKHQELTARTGMKIYFADPHSPWQRGSNENTNGLLRQYLPKGTDLSLVSQERLDEIADLLNTRPRQTLGWKFPVEVLTDHLQLLATNRLNIIN